MENNNKMKRSVRIKIISMGNTESGKSCIIKRYCEKRFVHKYLATIGIDYGVTKVNVKEKEVKVNIFDMAGHPIFYEVRNEFYKDTQGALLVFDVTDRRSFECLETWMNELKNDIGNPGDVDNIVFVVCANKIDLKTKRAVDETEARYWAESRGFHYYETSAQNGDGVQEMFQVLFEGVVKAIDNGGKRIPVNTQLGYTKEQVDAIQRLKNSKDNYERLGLFPGASKEEVNKSYRKLAVLLHPDKNVAPGSEEAFKLLVAARTSLLKAAR
ncbi:dnaJ homolog subfamily C member 27-like [Tubulanus polymorphus]|uniref:dnaJ homolog subfamily C member 27-like n=1 Tax=Tubulanus polymorphus TaxID=672921 RepID=UPI003DA4CD78